MKNTEVPLLEVAGFEFVYVSNARRDFPVIARFARQYDLPDYFDYIKAAQVVLNKIGKG